MDKGNNQKPFLRNRHFQAETVNLGAILKEEGISSELLATAFQLAISNKAHHGDFFGMLLAILHLSIPVVRSLAPKLATDTIENTCKVPTVIAKLIGEYAQDNDDVTQVSLPTIRLS